MFAKNRCHGGFTKKNKSRKGAYFFPQWAQERCAIRGAPQLLHTSKRSFFIAK
jgi:hypothetical protein